MKVKIFDTPTCPYCETLKAFLKEKGVEFEEVNICRDEKTKDEFIKKTGQMTVPVVEIDGKIVVGFDKEKICKLLQIKE
ncbi:MAG: glutaredoxin domain-containing protein [Candidatus Pacebacteria bacterium]|nr:glutaredoxin domain-containing protein [Candidatus Paceibacterota bacterium]